MSYISKHLFMFSFSSLLISTISETSVWFYVNKNTNSKELWLQFHYEFWSLRANFVDKSFAFGNIITFHERQGNTVEWKTNSVNKLQVCLRKTKCVLVPLLSHTVHSEFLKGSRQVLGRKIKIR